MTNWHIKEKLTAKSPKEREKEIIKILLKNRGLVNKDDTDNFFNPPSPFKLSLNDVGINNNQILKAVKRIIQAVENREKIVVYGDYDADGICATAIIWEILNKMGAAVFPYLPHRVDHGYGLSIKGLDQLIKENQPGLIITVDSGVTAIKEVAYANKKGIDLIISDHHVLPEKLPISYALVHTTSLSGSGVAWFLAREISRQVKNNPLLVSLLTDQLSLAAIGTIADILPVVGINRPLIAKGIEILRKTQRPGLLALFNEAVINPAEIDTYHIAFMVAPRLNATGRISHAMDSLRLICTRVKKRAQDLSLVLGSTNRERQKITQENLELAKKYLQIQANLQSRKVIIVYDTSYNQGVIGLVAGKLVEEYYRPALVIAKGEKFSKASARSITGFNIILALRQTAKYLVDCGGHPLAAGFTIETEKIGIFINEFTKLVNDQLDVKLLTKTFKADCEINFADINVNLYNQLQQFSPFGIGNPEPLFITRGVSVMQIRLVGKEGKHLKLLLKDKQGRQIYAIAFNQGDLYEKISREQNMDIIFNLSLNDWNGNNIELKVKNISVLPHQ